MGIELSGATKRESGWEMTVKEIGDRVGAAVLLLLLLPILLLVAAAVALGSGEPVLFRQRRVGKDGLEFTLFKFTTMAGDPAEVGEADAGWAAAILGRDNIDVPPDRQTAVGRVLRRFRLDELPQLLNVLRGEMSLVGPRPERCDYVRLFDEAVPGYRARTRVKPGLTGLAQVTGLVGPTSVAARAELDNLYIETWSLWLDLQILARTLPAVITGRMQVAAPAFAAQEAPSVH